MVKKEHRLKGASYNSTRGVNQSVLSFQPHRQTVPFILFKKISVDLPLSVEIVTQRQIYKSF